ncbi:hypothetical protein FH039_04845 [Thermococcus indicus]|uniref:KaiC-like domain-containing protein n=1 Tax=Thermococcus indicus TaxID=2586643 RepID=A0A4Y5SKZ3_9EURY|nr:hypothetical protein [Thermococcus indicus]QDA31064.1 hypothetical protein FH039_04845 [Thermococcus indicus]
MDGPLDIFPSSILHRSTVAVIYDAYSSAWQMLFLLLREAMENEYFAVISNYSVPLRSLISRFQSVGVDAEDALIDDKLAIIDVFGSRYSPLRPKIRNVFYLDRVEPETINPKVDMIYCGPLRERLKSDRAVRMVYTLDGAAMMLGEEQTLKLLNQTIAHKSVRFPESSLFLALNADMVSRRFAAWVSNVSDYVILAKSWIREDHVKELLYFIKAPYADFEPGVYSLRVSAGKKKITLERLSAPEPGSSAEE